MLYSTRCTLSPSSMDSTTWIHQDIKINISTSSRALLTPKKLKCYKQPVLASSDYCLGEGSWSILYFPSDEASGICLLDSDIVGDVVCVLRVFLHHDLKICAWGAGCIKAEVYNDIVGNPVCLDMSFWSSSPLEKKWVYNYANFSYAVQSMFPEYRLIDLNPKLIKTLKGVNKRQIQALHCTTDIAECIQTAGLPQWLKDKDIKPLGVEDLERALQISLAWGVKKNQGKLPHIWRTWYLMETEHVLRV